MTVSVKSVDFEAFFSQLNDGQRPYKWQSDLAHAVLSTGKWPEHITAPTGSGKSAVVDIHVFAVAAASTKTAGPMPPRRLVHVVGRRALVDEVKRRSEKIRDCLSAALADDSQGIVHRVAKSLQSLALSDSPLSVSTLRGGIVPDRGWQDDPVACQIVCATPDMAGSRLLFRGYGSSRGAKPREAGLLAYDSVFVIDEAHLNRQLSITARRVADLAAESPLAELVPVLQVVETTATPQDCTFNAIGVDAEDIRSGVVEPELQRRLSRPKPVTLHKNDGWLPSATTAASKKATVQNIVDLVNQALEKGQKPVGVVLNRVKSALEVSEALQASWKGADSTPSMSLLVGPRRRYEDSYDRIREDIDVYVATQTVEVGVDLDFGCLITDLASGTSLAQRAGRLNRSGSRESAKAHILCPEDLAGVREKDAAPYSPDELFHAHNWLNSLGDEGLSPVNILECPPPQAEPQKLALSHLEESRARLLSRTSEQFVAEPDLTFWLRDSLETDNDITVVGRALPLVSEQSNSAEDSEIDADAASSLLKAAPPQPHEAYPATIQKFHALMKSAGNPIAFVNRRGVWARVGSEAGAEVCAGDVVCVPHTVTGSTQNVLAPEGEQVLGDVLDPIGQGREQSAQAGSNAVRSVVLVTGNDVPGIPSYWRSSVLEICASLQSTGEEVSVVNIFDALVDRGQEDFLKAYLGLDDDLRPESGGEVTVACGDLSLSSPNQVSWVVFNVIASPNSDDEMLSEVTTGELVGLDDHQKHVADRVESIGTRLRLPAELIALLRVAAEYHDAGKSDQRFQAWLLQGSKNLAAPVAKSALTQLPKRQVNFLPAGWRHEQLSAAILWSVNNTLDPLSYRLVGTSHGYGRGAFVMNADQLLEKSASEQLRTAAEELFDTGVWDSLIDLTDRSWGVWATAWFEAILRSADVTVSKEGR